MTRNLLREAADEVDATRETVSETAARDRLASLADQLRSQADRNTTPALGALDRVQHALHEIAVDTDDDTVRRRLEDVREQIFAFLATLEDRGMTQHGANRTAESGDAA